MELRYFRSYCEENVWYLGQEPELAKIPRRAVFISNHRRKCAFFLQRSAPSPEEAAVWDYHVILICRKSCWQVWDLDSVLALPTPLKDYLKLTFGTAIYNNIHAPLFRVMEFDIFRSKLSSDRSHMRDSSGGWIMPPPYWQPIMAGGHPNLMDFVDMQKDSPGTVMNLHDFRKAYGD